MSRILHHVKTKDFRKTRQRKLDEQRLMCLERRAKEIKEQKEREDIEKLASPFKYKWRKKLNEGMTSSGVFLTNLPATGDINLQATSLDANGYEVSDDVSFSPGTNSGFTGGFSAENGIINLNGEGDYSTGVVSNYLDLTTVDSINITAIAGNNSNGGMIPTRSLQVAFFTDTDISDLIDVISPSTSTFTNVTISIPQQFRTKDVGFILYSNTSDGHGYHGRHFRSQTIPISGLNHTPISGLFPTSADGGASISNLISFYLRDNKNTQQDFYNLGYFLWFNSMSQRYGWFDNVGTQEDPELVYRTWPAAPVSGATTFDNITAADYRYVGQTVYNLFKGTQLYGISNTSFRRRAPMNVFVPLDSPEATSFIRTDPIMQGLSAEERLKKLEDMLDAGDEYLLKQLGMQGSVTRPADTGNIPSWEQSAGDEVAQLYPADYDKERAIDQMLLKGLQRGDYGTGPDVDRQIRQLQQNLQKGTPGGLPQAQVDQDTQIAQIQPAQQQRGATGVGVPDTRETNPGANIPPPGTMVYPKEWLPKQANQGKMPMVASYEPQGQLISEKKLRSPKEVIHKIPGYYDGKPAPLGFPDNPPPETINGFHPDLVDGKNVANRFNRLDPQSAKAMPLTGNLYIDAKVKKARIG